MGIFDAIFFEREFYFSENIFTNNQNEMGNFAVFSLIL